MTAFRAQSPGDAEAGIASVRLIVCPPLFGAGVLDCVAPAVHGPLMSMLVMSAPLTVARAFVPTGVEDGDRLMVVGTYLFGKAPNDTPNSTTRLRKPAIWSR